MTVAKLAAHQKGQKQGVSTKPFPEFRKLPPPRPEAPELPEELIPLAFRGWLLDLSERMQVPLEMPTVPALLALAGVVGRKLAILPKAQDDWLVVPNLWGGVVARPGKMKSPTLAEALQMIRRLASEAQQNHQAALDVASARLDSLRAKESAIKEKLKRHYKSSEETPDDLEGELAQVRGEIREQEQATHERRYIVNDPTIEKLGELLNANPWGLLLERDELAGWLRALERDDRRGNREFFLEAWNGNNPYIYDRIGRGTIRVPALCLTIVGGIQPTKLAHYVSEAVDGGFAADGLLQRFQMLVWPEDRGDWTLVDRPPDTNAQEAAFEVFRRLGELEGPGEGEPIPTVRFAADAQELFYHWLTRLEQRLHSDEMRETPAFESHLAKYRSLMPSLALLFHLAETEDFATPVTLTAARLAADWCEFLERHARKVYAAELLTDHVAAHALAQKIRQRAIESGMTIREIYNAGWSKLKKADRVLEGLAVLEEYGWARIETLKTRGRPTRLVAVNPLAVEGT